MEKWLTTDAVTAGVKQRQGGTMAQIISVSLPSLNDIRALSASDGRDTIAGYGRSSEGSRGYIVNNGVGNPAALDFDVSKDGPLTYDIRPVISFDENGDIGRAASGEGYAVMTADNGTRSLFKCVSVPERGMMMFADEPLAQTTLKELPDGVVPTMENVGAAAPLRNFAEHAVSIEVFDKDAEKILSSSIECRYEPNIRLEHDAQISAIPFGIDYGHDRGITVYDEELDSETQIDDEERGL